MTLKTPVADVEPLYEPREPQERTLHDGLDVDAEALLQRQDPVGVGSRSHPSGTSEDEPADDEVQRVYTEPERDLATE